MIDVSSSNVSGFLDQLPEPIGFQSFYESICFVHMIADIEVSRDKNSSVIRQHSCDVIEEFKWVAIGWPIDIN